jgi:hypothetical protein
VLALSRVHELCLGLPFMRKVPRDAGCPKTNTVPAEPNTRGLPKSAEVAVQGEARALHMQGVHTGSAGWFLLRFCVKQMKVPIPDSEFGVSQSNIHHYRP